MLKIRVSLKEDFKDCFPEKRKVSEEIDLICVFDNLKLIL